LRLFPENFTRGGSTTLQPDYNKKYEQKTGCTTPNDLRLIVEHFQQNAQQFVIRQAQSARACTG